MQLLSSNSVLCFCLHALYRRYAIRAHHPALIDLGHVGENFYLSSTTLGLGTCGLVSFDGDYINSLIGIDGDEEYTVYVQSVRTMWEEDKVKEDGFYSFCKENTK